MKRTIVSVTLTLVLVGMRPLLSHDFWLVPNAFRLSPGAELAISCQTSSEFPTSLSAVTTDRVASARVFTARTEESIENLEVRGRSLRLLYRPRKVGQILVAVSINPRSIEESPESFRRYLELEGAPEALARYQRLGLLPTDSITRRYAKYAKTIVEVGHGGPRVFDRMASQPLEFVPLSDPAAAEVGADLRFRLVFLDTPLSHARGHVSVAEFAESDSAYRDIAFETDANGEFTVAIAGNGLWNVRTLHIVPALPGSGADWDVHWATFVWGTSR